MGIRDKRSQYFQAIANHFFKRRGAPFFLSSKELDIISKWERTEIPLPVVLEGIRRSFENYRAKSGKRRKILSLVFCNLEVLKAFEQYKERKIGYKEMRVERGEKRVRAKTEIEKFLKHLPQQLKYLEEVYSRAKKMLSQRSLDEEALERMEEEAEELLLKNSPSEEEKKVNREILKEYEFGDKEEFLRIFRIKLVKLLRDKYKIPYISLFYY